MERNYYYLDFLGLHLGEPDPELPDTSLEAASAHRPLQQEAAAWPTIMAFLTAVVFHNRETDLIIHETMDMGVRAVQVKDDFLRSAPLLHTDIHFSLKLPEK
jgi:hypothetical protein